MSDIPDDANVPVSIPSPYLCVLRGGPQDGTVIPREALLPEIGVPRPRDPSIDGHPPEGDDGAIVVDLYSLVSAPAWMRLTYEYRRTV